MKNKFKYAVSAATAAALALPALAMAQWQPGLAGGSSGLSGMTFGTILKTVMNWALGLLGFLAVLAFIIAGIMYITAAGDEDRIASAKKTMTYAIIGLVVALIGYIVVVLISNLIYGNVTV